LIECVIVADIYGFADEEGFSLSHDDSVTSQGISRLFSDLFSLSLSLSLSLLIK
jgi:hypothetical protein